MKKTYMHKKTTGVDLLLDLPLADLGALADDAAERVARARLHDDRNKALRWQRCIFWTELIARVGADEQLAMAWNRARKTFLSL